MFSSSIKSRSPPFKTSFTYTGREYEPELGMYYYRARFYDPSVGRFLQQDTEPGKLSVPPTFLSKYIYAANNPTLFNDPFGKSWFSDFFDYLAVGFVGLADILWGIATLDIARVLTGAAMVTEYLLGPVNLILNGRLPKYSLFDDHAHAVDNSLLAQIFDVPGFSLGPGMFLQYEPDGEKLLRTKQHEYGHTLQYEAWGGWEYLRIGIQQRGVCGSFLEFDADRRAKERYNGFTPVYGECR
jgi:RHS repeat-associated protein